MTFVIQPDKLIRMDKDAYARIRTLFIAVLAISVTAVGVAAAIGGSSTVWVRGAIVTVIAAVLIGLAKRAYAGSRGAYLRMRLMTTIAPVAVVVIVVLPHDGIPRWMKAERVIVGLLLAAAAITLSRGKPAPAR